MAPRTGQAAIDYARSRIGPGAMPASGYCLQFVRQCFNVGSYYGSAIDAWNGAQHRHPGDRHPPPAVPVYFSSPSIYDHVAFFVSPNEVISTFNADVRAFDGINGIEVSFSGKYLGWAEDINTVRIYDPPAGGGEPETPDIPVEGEDRMELIRIVEDGRIMVVGTYQFAQVPDMETYGALAKIWGTYQDVDIVSAQRMHDQINRNLTDLTKSVQGILGQQGG